MVAHQTLNLWGKGSNPLGSTKFYKHNALIAQGQSFGLLIRRSGFESQWGHNLNLSIICENCGKEHDGSYGSGRFCSKECARSYSSKQNKNELKEAKCINCGKTILIK